MKVSSPDGTTWRVSRRWSPWRRRVWGVLDRLPSLGYISMGNDPLSAVLALIMLLMLIPFVLVGIVALLEIGLVLLILPFAILGRVLLGRQWTVEVRRGWRAYAEERAGDWQASGQRIHALAAEISSGTVPVQTLGLAKDAKKAARAAEKDQRKAETAAA